MDLAYKILSDPLNKWVFSSYSKNVYIVGGYLRDLLRGRINKDKDYVIKGNVRNMTIRASEELQGTFIELKKNQTYRVALKGGHFIDFTRLERSIVHDLGRRDYTINALAWSPEKGIVDPFNGESDLKRKIVKLIHPDNLARDPLRVLRAYRIAAQLDLRIDDGTRKSIRKYSRRLKSVAQERITEELFKLLCCADASHYLTLSAEDKVLHEVIGVTNHYLRTNLLSLRHFDHFIKKMTQNNRNKRTKTKIINMLNYPVGQGLTREGLVRLSILMERTEGKKVVRGTIKCSKLIKKKLQRICNARCLSGERITNNRLFEMFKEADGCEFELALVVIVMRQRNVDKYIKRADDFIKIKKNKIIDGYDIQHALHTGPSGLIGEILEEVQRRRYLGTIKNRADALKWITSNLT
jgi:tRNA nucleotidyltransferase/poly(A) polymerase